MGAAIDMDFNPQARCYEPCARVVLYRPCVDVERAERSSVLELEPFLPPAWYVCQTYKNVERITHAVE